jgi:hypothetical protein
MFMYIKEVSLKVLHNIQSRGWFFTYIHTMCFVPVNVVSYHTYTATPVRNIVVGIYIVT